MQKPFSVIFVLYLLLTLQSTALAQMQVQPTIGGQYCYTRHENISSNIEPVFKPNGGILLNIPVTSNLQLRTGLAFTQIGFNTQYRETSVRASTNYVVQNTASYLSIPVLASYNIYSKNDFQYWIDAGVNYNFFVGGVSHFVITDYLNDVQQSATTFDHKINGPLIRTYTDPSEGRDDYTGLDISFRLQIRVIWAKHYTAGIYWDNGLYNLLADPVDASYISMHSIGISLGCIIL